MHLFTSSYCIKTEKQKLIDYYQKILLEFNYLKSSLHVPTVFFLKETF